MFSHKTHNFQDGLGQTYAFTLQPQLDPEGSTRPEAVVRCKVYARQTLNSIVDAQQDPFHYGLMDLWLDAFQKPWARPRDLNQLVDDLAAKMAGGELFVYMEDSPVWHFQTSGPRNDAQQNPAHDDGKPEPVRALPSARSQPGPAPRPGLHNQEWPMDGIEVKNFRTEPNVDIKNLSADERVAAVQLEANGWQENKIREILESGHSFECRVLEPGDRLYGFTSKGFPKSIKDSPYWLDETSFRQAEAKHYRDNAWDREAIKDELALPCYNRADAVDIAEVTEQQTVVRSRIGKATELLSYSGGSGSTGLFRKVMSGGGMQVAPHPSKLKKVVSHKA